jgi:PST family polysaccharide transporter
VALLAILLREPASTVLLNDPSQATQVALVAAAVPFLAMAGVEVGVVNGFHRVARLSAVTGLTALVTGGSLVVSVWLGGTAAIGAGLLAGAVGAWVIARVASSGLVPGGGGRVETRAATGRLAGIGVPYLASQLLGTGAQLLLPFLVLAILSASDVGLYRAANTLSIAYLAFLLNAMAQDYYPRLSGAAGRPELADMARTQLRLVMAIAVPVILVAMAAAPIAIEILYSSAFLPATDLLRWQLIGDLVKLPAWVISFVILARASGRRFLVVETIGGLSFAVLGWAGLVAFGLVGTGIAYLATYLGYFAVVALAARPSAGNLISREHGLMGALVVACIAAQLLRPAAGDLPISGLTMLGAAAWVLLVSIPALRGRELGWRQASGAA